MIMLNIGIAYVFHINCVNSKRNIPYKVKVKLLMHISTENTSI